MSKRVAYLKKIIRIRKKLIEMKSSGKSTYESIKVTAEIEKYVKAYGNTYGEDYWKGFLNRRYYNILFLIPANKAQDKFISELNELL